MCPRACQGAVGCVARFMCLYSKCYTVLHTTYNRHIERFILLITSRRLPVDEDRVTMKRRILLQVSTDNRTKTFHCTGNTTDYGQKNLFLYIHSIYIFIYIRIYALRSVTSSVESRLPLNKRVAKPTYQLSKLD